MAFLENFFIRRFLPTHITNNLWDVQGEPNIFEPIKFFNKKINCFNCLNLLK
jgi:hypothetical protein